MQPNEEIIAWVGAKILHHEADLRFWLKRLTTDEIDVDDVVQEAYCRLAGLKKVDHILNPRAYFFTTARMIVLERLRRSRVVRIDSLTEAEALSVVDSGPDPERIISGRLELERIQRIIAALPPRCRAIFELKRIQGLSQKEIAARLGISENVVEMQSVRGLKLVLKAITDSDDQALANRTERKVDEQARDSRTD